MILYQMISTFQVNTHQIFSSQKYSSVHFLSFIDTSYHFVVNVSIQVVTKGQISPMPKRSELVSYQRSRVSFWTALIRLSRAKPDKILPINVDILHSNYIELYRAPNRTKILPINIDIFVLNIDIFLRINIDILLESIDVLNILFEYRYTCFEYWYTSYKYLHNC